MSVEGRLNFEGSSSLEDSREMRKGGCRKSRVSKVKDGGQWTVAGGEESDTPRSDGCQRDGVAACM